MAIKTHQTIETASSLNLDASTPNTWRFQTFTPLESYSATQVALKCFRNDSGATGALYIKLYLAGGTDGNGFKIPSGSALATGTIDISTLEHTSPGDWAITTLDSSVSLTAGTRYAIVVHGSISAGDYVYFRVAGTTAYGFGQSGYSSNAGSTWQVTYPSQNVTDFTFKVYDSTSFTPQIIYVAGAVYGGKHLWKCKDDGTSITVEDSYALAGDVLAIAYSQTTRRLYASIGAGIYCYDSDDMSLVASWGSSGYLATTYPVYAMDIDSLDYLAIAQHDSPWSGTGYGFVSLVDSSGSIVWSTGSYTYSFFNNVSFNTQGHVNAGKLDQIIAGRLLNRSNGSTLVTYPGGALGTATNTIRSDREDPDRVYFDNGTTVYCYDGVTQIWSKTVSSAAQRARIHSSDIDYLVSMENTYVKSRPDGDGATDSRADYSPLSCTPAAATIYGASYNTDNKDIYVITLTNLYTINISGSVRSSVQVVPSSVISSVFWGGSAYVAPIITDQSSSTDADHGDNVSFYVTATGNPEPTYQWYKDGSPLSGETNNTLNLSSVDVGDGGTYYCIATNVAGSDQSADIVLQIVPYITVDISDHDYPFGSYVTLSITALGSPNPTYQWYKDGSPISGATSTNYSFYAAYSSAGVYKCTVTNAAGSADSSEATIGVVSNPYISHLFNMVSDLSVETS